MICWYKVDIRWCKLEAVNGWFAGEIVLSILYLALNSTSAINAPVESVSLVANAIPFMRSSIKDSDLKIRHLVKPLFFWYHYQKESKEIKLQNASTVFWCKVQKC